MAGRESKPPEQEQRGEGFLSRWSRRKAEAREVEATEAKAPAREDVPAATPEQDARRVDRESVDPNDLPDIETLTAESDFTVFMRKGVPEELRRQALRKLWRSNPVLANLDGLLEYGEDYSHIGRGGETVRTAYQVGRGFARKLEEIAADEQERPSDAPAEPAEPAAAPEQTAQADPAPPREPEAERAAEPSEPDPATSVQKPVKPQPRRRLPKRG